VIIICNYIKDNGEQCGMDTEPFCRHHEDSEQAKGAEIDVKNDGTAAEALTVSKAIADAQSDFSGVRMENHCQQCETPLRRTERLTEHSRIGGQMVIEAVLECDCSEYVFASKNVSNGRLPDGWV